VDHTHVLQRGRKLSYFGGCDYFRLSSHPVVLRAVEEGVKKWGLNVAASRMTTGNHRLYEELEARTARFFGAESALLASNGYVANLVAAQALAGQFMHALIDARAHASLRDAARFLECPVTQFEHRDASDVARLAQRLGRRAKLLLLTDGMFSHDGSVASLKEYLQVLPSNAVLLVDDAHGAGVLGVTGKGSLEQEGVGRERIVQTITFSKAFGVYGGAILGSRRLRAEALARSHMFAGNTPLPLPLVAGVLMALDLLQKGDNLRRRLWRNTAFVKLKLRQAGIALPKTPGPIIPVVPGSAQQSLALRRRLRAAGIHPPFIQYPGGPPGGYFRFALSSAHGQDQLTRLAETLIEAHRSEAVRRRS
jgi:7-keto-8-aminopelargonate synthetase-like enzyme